MKRDSGLGVVRRLGYTPPSKTTSRSSSVVERIIGNDEVGSSTLPCGTIRSLNFQPL